MNNAWHFAVDFGTSNTSAAHTSPLGGAVETLALSHRSNLMPSAVFVDDEGTQRNLLTGDTALSRGRRDPSKLMMSPKRYIDHDNVQLAGRDANLVSVVAAVLHATLERGKAQHAGQMPATVTMTHPEAWSVHSIEQLVSAAKAAGVDESAVRTISEPRAAAVHYAAQQQVAPGNHVAVFDFGGGTLDIAVLEAQQDGNFRVVSAKGDNSLGGRTVDNLLFRWVLAQVEHDDPDFADYLRNAPISTMHSLEENIRDAKEILSDTSSATITISTPAGERDLLITRDEFNQVIDPSIERAIELTRAALDQAGVNTVDTPVYMTGGSSRIPHVQNRLAEIGNVMTLDDPKTVVSRGALLATICGFTEDSARGQRKDFGFGQAAGAAGAAGIAGAAGGAAASGATGTAGASSTGGAQNPFAAAPGGSQNGWNAPQSATRIDSLAASTSQAASPYGANDNNTQANPFAGGPSSSSVPSSTGTAAKGGSKTPLIIGGLVAAALLLGGGGYAVSQMGGDKGNGSNENNTAAATSSPTPAKSSAAASSGPSGSTAAGGSSDGTVSDRHFTKRFPDSTSFVPAEFTDKVGNCLDPKLESDSAKVLNGFTSPVSTCLMDIEQLGEHEKDIVFNGSRYVAAGDDAAKAFEFAKSSGDWKSSEIQNGSGDKPTILQFEKNGSGTKNVVIYWEQQKMFMYSYASNRSNPEDMLKYFGFLK